MIKRLTLPSGVEVVISPMASMKSVSCGIWIRSGGRHENPANAGISHFIEHLLFKGTLKRDGVAIKEAVEGLGGSFNGFTSEEFTCYLIKILGTHIDIAVDVLSDMVLNPKFDPKDIEKERTVIMEEIKMYLDQPMHYVHELLGELMWPNNPLGMPLAGTFETVKSITRNDLINYKNSLYNSKNIVISIAGNVNKDDVLKLIKKYFTLAKTDKINKFKRIEENNLGPRLKINFKKTEQAHLAIGFHALSRLSPDRYAANMLNIILGANMSSRLFQEVREERGLAYEISSHNKNYDDTGAFIISAGVDIKKTNDALKVIFRELSKIKKEPVSKDELKRAKEFYKGQMLMALEDTASKMLWIGERVISRDKLMSITEILEIIDSMTIEDIRKVANMIFTEGNLNMAVIGPIKEKDLKDSFKLN